MGGRGSAGWRKKAFGFSFIMLAAVEASLLHAQIGVADASHGVVLHEATVSTAPASLEQVLRATFRSADVVFAGEVIDISRNDDSVSVTWRVEDAVLGAATGATYNLREWAGMWAAGAARYTVGQRALVMLHAPSAAGYASPVGGGDGIVPMHGGAPNGVLDLRLLAQHVVVTDAARLRPMLALRSAGGLLPLSNALQARAAALPGRAAPAASRAMSLLRAPEGDDLSPLGSVAAGSTGVPSAAPALENVSRMDASMVLSMLHAWHREAQRVELAR